MDDTENQLERQQYLELLDELLEGALDDITGPKQLSADVIRDTAIKAFNQAGFPAVDLPIEVVTFRRLLVEESDRGCALSAAAYIESQLGLLIQSVLLADNNVLKDTFTGTGPLATFSSRINVAYLLGLIGRNVKSDLHSIRKIRNEFAHNPDNISFSDDPVANRCRALYHDTWQEVLPPRKKFVRVVLGITAVIHAAMKNAKRPQQAFEIDLTTSQVQEMGKKIKAAIDDQVETLKSRKIGNPGSNNKTPSE